MPASNNEEPKKEESDLGMLKRQLYAREESQELIDRQQEISELGTSKGEAFGEQIEEPSTVEFTDVLSKRTKKRKKIIRYTVLALITVAVLGAAVGGTIWYRLSKQLTENQLTIAIKAPGEVASSDVVSYEVAYRNDSRVTWQNVEVALQFPQGFIVKNSSVEMRPEGKKYLVSLPDLAPGTENMFEVSGQLIGEQQSSQLAEAVLTVSPDNFPASRYSRSASVTSSIRSVPIDFSIEASEQASQGEKVLAKVHIRNVSSSPIEGAYLHLEIPPGASLAPDDPDFTPGFSVPESEWQLPTMAPFDELQRTYVLYAEGQAGERRTVAMTVGVRQGDQKFIQKEVAHVITLTTPELVVDQIVNKQNSDQTVEAGQIIDSVVTYRNTGSVGLKNAVIKVLFEGNGLDEGSLKLKAGAYDPITKTITWTSATVPELANIAPAQSGEISYSFTMLSADKFPTRGDTPKNQTLTLVSSIDSPDIPTPTGVDRKTASDRLVLSVRTALTLTVDSFYDDGRLGITSTGPLPPKVGEQTTYTVRFRAGSTLNDAGNMKMVAVLPDGVKYTGNIYKTAGEIDFNDRSGELIWEIPLLEGLTGRSKLAQELQIQVAITPGADKKGFVIPFLNKITLNATDQFTEDPVSLEFKDQFPTTETASPKQGTVE